MNTGRQGSWPAAVTATRGPGWDSVDETVRPIMKSLIRTCDGCGTITAASKNPHPGDADRMAMIGHTVTETDSETITLEKCKCTDGIPANVASDISPANGERSIHAKLRKAGD